MSLLTAIQNACNELGLTAPSTVISNSDPTIVQLLALANREGKEFSSIGEQWSGWPEQRKEYTFTLNPVGPYLGDTTAGSPTVINMSSTTNLLAGYGCTGSGLYPYMLIKTVDSSSQITLTAPAASTQTQQSIQFGQVAYVLPSDIQFFLSATHWDRNFRWQMLGPLDPQEWQTIISGISPVGPRLRFRVMNNAGAMNMWVQPVPGATQTDLISYEYSSNQWCQSNASVGQTVWTADTDVYLWPEDTLTLGIIWRFRRAKGLDYSEEFNMWRNARDRQIARSGGNRTLPLNAQAAAGIRLLSTQNVPDTGFGS